MAKPRTWRTLLELVRQSGLVDEPALERYVQEKHATPGDAEDAAVLARALVRDGLLTKFQANQLLQGRWRGFTLGKYQILELLGEGGMGRVFLCVHVLLKRPVAIKVLPEHLLQEPGYVERFYREARAVAALDHPNIVRAYDMDHEGTLHLFVMEYVDGASLQDIVAAHGPMDPVRACHYIAQAAAGLDHACRAGLVHRDIKPGNILVDRQGAAKILDLGLARFMHEDSLTRNLGGKNVLGTADYLAPEQALDSHDVDVRTDIYGLGATFFYLLTGRAPFAQGNVTEKLLWVQFLDPPAVHDLRPEAPRKLSAIVARMMAKDRSERFQTPLEVVDALTSWTGAAIAAPPDHEMPKLSLAARNAIRGLNRGGAPDSSARLPAAPASASPASASPASAAAASASPASAAAASAAAASATTSPSSAATLAALVSQTRSAARLKTPLPGEAPAAPSPNGGRANPKRSRARWLIAGLAVILAAATALTVWLLLSNGEPVVTTRTGKAPAGPIPSSEAHRFLHQECTVEMDVKAAALSSNGKTLFLNSHADYRDPENFPIVLHNWRRFEDAVPDPLAHFQGKRIRVTGRVAEYRGRPEIVVRDLFAIRVVDGEN
ncbi:MAG: protein kinase [Gemmataceae bacterium]|nr:protein kinase [Gemmataceae bacterium]